ncbi:hypothetical protein KFE94_11950 [bacterium SCSIO 12643]|nr:hypothetical protein KFE94_11950 [bacterium SCSIO 12643]
MGNRILFITLFLFVIVSGNAQELKNGGYMNFNEINLSKPTYDSSFKIIERTTGQIKAIGGNDYYIESEQVSKKIIKKEIWGVVSDNVLYLNGIPITGLMWYAKVEHYGKYCFLRPAYPSNPKIKEELGLNNKELGYMFGAVGGAIQGATLAMLRIPLIYELETGNKMLLTDHNLSKLLENHTELKNRFDKEVDKQNEDILLKYLIELNELVKN